MQTFAAGASDAMSNNTVIDEFLNYLRFERHFSPHTAKCYAADLHQFCEFLQDGAVPPSAQQAPAGGFDVGHGGGTATATAPAAAPPQAEVGSRETLLAVETDDVRRFLAFLRDREYSKSTTARKLATLRSFFKFCLKRGHVQINPLTPIRTPKHS